MTKYSLGFIFTPDFEEVLLMHKTKPDWQKGKINGIGGKLEPKEDYIECLVRETQEETGLLIPENKWIYVATISSKISFVEIFACVYSGNKTDAKSVELEKVEWFDVNKLPANIMSNLSWLIPLSLDKLQNNKPNSVMVKY